MNLPDEPTRKQEPELPEGQTPKDLLDNVSDKDRKVLAEKAGMTLEAYDRYLRKLASKQNIAQSVASAKQVLATAETREDPSLARAREAIVRSIREIDILNAHPLSADEVEMLEKRAFECLKYADSYESHYLSGSHRMLSEATSIFKKIFAAEATQKVHGLIKDGLDVKTARQRTAENLRIASNQDNVPPRRYAREYTARAIQNRNTYAEQIQKLNDMAMHYEKGVLTAEETDLLRRILQCMKAAYNMAKLDKEMISRFDLTLFEPFLQRIFSMYKKRGPTQTAFENVAGPSEVFDTTQIAKGSTSGRGNIGYNRRGKRRPHRGTRDDERF